jgi:hypothetical protein
MKKETTAKNMAVTTPDSGFDLHAECDFSDIDPKQLQACMYYEYGREAMGFITAVMRKRDELRERTMGLKDGDRIQMAFEGTIQELYNDFAVFQLGNSKGFPLTPWQRLPPDELKSLSSFVKDALRWTVNGMRSVRPALLLDAKQSSDTGSLQSWCSNRSEKLRLNGNGKVGFFYVDLGAQEKTLIDSFRDWLRRQEPRPIANKIPRRGRHGGIGYGVGYCREALNQLGALRLRHNTVKFEEANAFMDQMRERRKEAAEKSRFLVYSQGRRFNEACENAVKKYRSLFGGGDSAFPMSYPSGWRK